FLPFALAQKRVQSTVDPNVDTYSGNADLFVPSSGEFVATPGDMEESRVDHIAVALLDGAVLIAGGQNNRYLDTAEIFDPATGMFKPNYQTIPSPVTGLDTTTRGNLKSARSGAGGVRLLDGRVLIAGGFNGSYISLSEIYDPDTGSFSLTTSGMRESRYHPNLTLMRDGRVLITGGVNSEFLSSAEVYNPFNGFFTLVSDMSEAREGHTATLLQDGKVLVVGGCANTDSNKVVCDKFLSSAEIYDPVEGTFEATGSLNEARAEHAASLLSDGRVLITGGTDGINSLASAEIYDPASGTFTYTNSMGMPKKGHTATTLQDGRILIAGGYSETYLNTAEIFTPSSETFIDVSSSMSSSRLYHTATALADGRVLLTGGLNSEPLVFDVNIRVSSDNVSPDTIFSPDSQVGFIPYTGSGIIVAFSATTGEVLDTINTGGSPVFMTELPDGDSLAVVSALDNRIFIVSMGTMSLVATYTFPNAEFGFGSQLALSPDGSIGYISSTGTGEVIQFDTASGNEIKRLTGLETPTQITETPDGATILVVDTTTAEIYFINTSSMGTKFIMSPRDFYAAAGFTIYNKAVLSPDGATGVIAGWDIDSSTTDSLFYFRVSTGEIISRYRIGDNPTYTTLTPDGTEYMILSSDSVSLLPINSPGSGVKVPIPGSPLSSSNIVFSADDRYAFYATASLDQAMQFDLQTQSVVGAYDVGEISSSSQEQPTRIAITPDGQIISVINLGSNELDLLVDAKMLKVPEFINDRDQFTGITLINLSENSANLNLKAFNNSGNNLFLLSDGNLDNINAVDLGLLPPNGQLSLDLSQIIDFNNTVRNDGHLEIISDQDGVVGFAVTGSIGSSFLNSYLTGMSGMPMYRFPDRLYDWISPDLSLEELRELVPNSDFVFTNPNYNSITYQIIHYGSDGSQLEGNTREELAASGRDVLTRGDLFTDTLVSSVLLTGGRYINARRTADLFLPDDIRFRSSGVLLDARYGHAASLLASGEVLVTGGRDGVYVINTAEIYSPIQERFVSIKGTMSHPRYRHTSTALNDGTVLVAGGQNSISINDTAEIYDPITDSFSSTAGNMNSARDAHTATLLQDGRVLLVGGIDGYGLSSTAEIYDPATSTFSATGSMRTGRAFHEAVRLKDGRVLILGGYNGAYLSSAEIYDPLTGVFSEISSMNVARSDFTATLMPDGTVLIAGGESTSGTLDSVEFYYPSTDQFALLPQTLNQPRSLHTATAVSGGKVLFVGGSNGDTVVPDSEIYYPESQAFSEITTGQLARTEHTATLLRSLIAGYLRGSSEEGLIFRQKMGANARRVSTEGINVERYDGITSLYSPYF
ncbi:MAG: kelch repeat-containing protein, partial [Acidobacteriota bacterium]